MGDEEAIERIAARVAFFETSLAQLKKDLPKYILYQADSKGVHTALPKGLRTVASSEPHSALQFFLFLYAKKQEELAKYQENYAQLAKDSKDMLDSWEKQLISPMKILIQDQEATLKKKKPMKQSTTILPGPVLSSSVSLSQTGDSSNQTVVDSQSNVLLPPQPIVAGDVLNQLLPIHAKLFEKHRVENIKRLFRSLLWNEVTYHAKCLEAYSHLLECLDMVEDVDGEDCVTNNS